MNRVYVASPFNGFTPEQIRQNIVYARLCMLDSLGRGEAPYLSHLLYTQVWAETPELRAAGLRAGDAWRDSAELVALYCDLGLTPGMERASDGAVRCKIPRTRRLLYHENLDPRDVRTLLATLPLDDFPALRISTLDEDEDDTHLPEEQR